MFVCARGASAQVGGEPAAETVAAGERVYRSACASCHGVDGRGMPQAQVGFTVPLPDFTDCSFATREPEADWTAITHRGGPVRGFSELMPAFGAALTRDEIERSLRYLRGFCEARNWPRGELNLPRPLVTEKAYPEDEAVFSSGFAVEGRAAVLNEIVYERRLGARSQFEIVVPFGWRRRERPIEPSGVAFDWTGGIGDIAISVKHAALHTLRSGSILSFAGELKLPTGDEDDGFGVGTTRFEPFLAFGQILPADAFLQLQAGFELPFDTGRAPEEAFWRGVFGASLTSDEFGRTWSPMVEVLAARELVHGVPPDWDLVPQIQVTLNRRQNIMANLGVRIPLNRTDVRQTEILLYLLWDWFDGGLLDGW
jgi:hypothetical protein